MKPIIATLVLVLAAVAVQAHHSTRAFYDREASAEIEGSISSVFWRNPHVRMTLLVQNQRGEREEWDLEGGTINTLRRRGFSEDSFTVGDRVRVAGAPSIRGLNALFVTNMLLPDGREAVFTDQPRPPMWAATGADDSSDTRAADTRLVGEAAVADMFRVWSFGRIYRLDEPLQLTDAAVAARSGWDPLTDDPSLRCEPPGMPNAILNPYPIELIDEDERIRLRIEEWDAERVIHMSDIGSQPSANPSRLGYSTGAWEGDTLVIRTSSIDAPYLDDSGTPMSIEAQMTERFSLRREEGRLDYEVTVTDPVYLAEPAVWSSAWIWRPGARIQVFDCTLPE